MSDVSVDHRVVVEALRDHCRAQAAVGNRPQRTVKMAQANALDWLLAQVPPREPTFRDPDTGRTGSHAPPLSVAVAAEPLLVEREPQQTKYAVTATDGLGNVSTVYEIDPPASATPSEPPIAETDLQAMSRCYNETLREFAALRAQNEALQQDARRYRYLRDKADLSVRDVFGAYCEQLNQGMDAAVDAALQDEQAARDAPA